ncbi:hypothetical protein AB0P37_08450 [Streptomyces antimycoticus]|uniref:hypothetical protein n=1 Tax=Streptomyces antimycoticus TaxID=68175 RepID=UPI00342404E2
MEMRAHGKVSHVYDHDGGVVILVDDMYGDTEMPFRIDLYEPEEAFLLAARIMAAATKATQDSPPKCCGG